MAIGQSNILAQRGKKNTGYEEVRPVYAERLERQTLKTLSTLSTATTMSLSNAWPPSRPYTLDLTHPNPAPGFPSNIGTVRGLTFLTSSKGTKHPRSHYFGAVPYAQAPERWKLPQPLPPTYKYGSSHFPESFIGEVGVCPQPEDFGAKPELEDIGDWDEHCLESNIWIPVEDSKHEIKRPEKGWPVMVFLHGGFLSFGSPNGSDYIGLLDTDGRCIVVVVGYRVNLFGFLASKELADEDQKKGGPGYSGNYGFWDQRCALEWVRDRIRYFGGDAEQVTLCGYSAGALSAFHQLTYEFSLPKEECIIRRLMMLANGPGMQPRDVAEKQLQFDQLTNALRIPRAITGSKILAQLRSMPAVDLVKASLSIQLHEFRHTTDGFFIKPDLFDDIVDGAWTQKFIDSGVELLLCECETEHFAFATWHELEEDTLQAVRERLSVDYPKDIIDGLIDEIYVPDGRTLPSQPINGHVCKMWNEFFGVLYAELQVHAIQRGFLQQLFQDGAGHMVRRVRVGWRAKKADSNFPKEMGPTHGTDTALWFFGDGVGLELLKKEEKIAREWCEGWWSWLRGDGWGTGWEECSKPSQMKYIDAKGTISHCGDSQEDWLRGLAIWTLIRRLQK